MSTDTSKKYEELLLKLIKNKIIIFKFNRNGAGIKLEKEEEFNKLLLEYNINTKNEKGKGNSEKQFINFAFEIIKSLRDFALNKKSNSGEIVKKILELRPEIKDAILIKTNSNLTLLNDVKCQILTKRDVGDIENTFSNSILLSLDCNEPLGTKDNSKIYSLELDIEDAKKIINVLNKTIESLETLK